MKKLLFVCLAIALMVSPAVMLAAPVVAGEVVVVYIDVKPGSFPNSINPNGNGVISVAILTTDNFDASTVDDTSVRFGPTAEPAHRRAHIEDVDGDGDLDLVLHFKTQDIGIAPGDTEAAISGQTYDGVPFIGTDLIRTIP